MLPILACGAGIYVGLHFNILALLPLSILGAGAYIVSAWAGGQGLLDSIAVVLFPVKTRPAYLHLRSRLNIRHSERA